MSAARVVGSRAMRGWLAAAALAVALPLPAFAGQQLVVVRKTGQAAAYSSPSKIGASAMAACADASVAFAFVVEPREGGTLELERSAGARDVIIDVSMTCSSLHGTALVSFDAQGGNAVRGTDYLSVPGVALLDLSAAADNPGAGAPVAAPVRIEVLDNPQAGTAPVTFSIVRREGSFQGMGADGTPVVGAIPGSNDPVVAVTILGRVTIQDAADIVPGIDPAASAISAATTAYCRAGGGGAGAAGCTATQRAADLIADPLTPAAVRDRATTVLENNLLAIAPDETTALAFIAPQLATGQRDNVAQRLAAMRTGNQGGRISADGLTLVSHGMPIALSGLPALWHAVGDEESERNEEQRTLLGGTRLGIWVNGTIGGGQRDRRAANSGFDSDTREITAGIDYRFSDRFFAGAAFGISQLDLDFERDQGSLEVDAKSLHGYAGYSLPNGIGFDASLSYLRSDYRQRRVIELLQLDAAGTGVTSLGRDIARGDTKVSQFGGSLGITWTIMREAWTIAPQAQVSMIRTTYDAFAERGPSAFNLGYRERRSDGHSLSVGSYFDRTFATSVGAFRPYARAFWFADSGSSKDLLADFLQTGSGATQTPLRLSMEEGDRRYGSGEVGLGFSRPIGTRTVDFNAGYMQMFGYSDWDRWALRFDVRVPL